MNNKAQKIFIRVMCVVLAVLMAASVLISILASTAGAVTQDEIDKLQKDLDGLRQQQKDLKSEINSAKYEKSQLTEKKKLLDQRIEVTMDVIANYDAQIEQYGSARRTRRLSGSSTRYVSAPWRKTAPSHITPSSSAPAISPTFSPVST